MNIKFIFIFILLFIFTSIISAQKNNDQKLLQLSRELHEKYSRQKEEALRVAKEKNFPVKIDREGEFCMELMRLSKNGMPEYYITSNRNSGRTIETDELWPGGGTGLNLSGDGFLIGEWDGGLVRTTHQEFDDGVGGSRVTQRDTGVTHWHSTHVAGTMIAEGQDAAAHGMAFEADLDSYDWNDDGAEMAAAAADDDLIISNHSYGLNRGWHWDSDIGAFIWFGDISVSATEDYLFGFYDDSAQDWDQIAHDAPEYLIFKAASNDRNDDHNGGHFVYNGTDWVWSTDVRDPDGDYDCLPQKSTAKNIMTVGSVEEIQGGWTAPGDVVPSEFSSWGPCDDGRIKPDIVADGDDLYSTDHDNDTDYRWSGGTSMSSPAACGSAALLQENYENLNGSYMLAATLKDVIIHTADEAGPNDGPDYMFGWGLMNSETAVDLITLDNTLANGCIYEDNLANTTSQKYYFYCDGTEDIKATICWTDPAGTPPAATLDPTNHMLVNDLDMRIVDASMTTYYPWSCNPANPANAATQAGDNDVDNVEQVFIDNPAEGYYYIQISHKGNIGAGQDYSLVFSGMVMTTTNTWTGAFNYFWHNDDNWTLGHIPTATENVIITTDGYDPPKVDIYDEECNNLTINSGATLDIQDQNLIVNGFVTIHGELEMSNTASKLYVGNSIFWESGSTASMTGSATIYLENIWEFKAGANVQLNSGFVDFHGSGNSYICCNDADCYFNHIRNNKSGTHLGNSALSNQPLSIHGNLYMYGGCELTSYTDNSIVLNGYLNNMGGNIHLDSGIFKFNGNPSAVALKPNVGDYFNDLTFSGSGTLNLDNMYSGDLHVNGNVVLAGGTLVGNAFNLYVGGNWTNTVGTAGFTEGTGKVIFNGANSAAILTNETFYDLHLDKTYSGFAGLETGSGNDNGVDVTVTHDLELIDGTMELNNPTNLAIGNILRIYDGASFNANDSGTINISIVEDWFNYNASGGFDAGDNSVVTFNGTTSGAIQVVRENEYFNDIVINSESSYVRPSSPGGTTIYCKNMDIVAGKLKVSSYKVVVDEALTISGILDMNSPDDSLFVGDITWESGSSGLVADGLINVSSNWTNSGGTFNPGTGLVIFDSNGGAQDVTGSNTFYNVQQINSSEYLRFYGDTTILNDLELHYLCWAYDNFQVSGVLNIDNLNSKFTASGNSANATIATLNQGGTLVCNGTATLTVNDLVEDGIYGKHYVDSPGGTLNLTSTGWIDLNGELHITGGTMNISGLDSFWPHTHDALIEMSDGILDFTNCGIYLHGLNTLITDITGGTIRTVGDFTGNRSDFNPSGGTIELYGTTDANLSMGAGSNFHNILINKAVSDEIINESKVGNRKFYNRDGSVVELTRSNTITAASELDINGNFVIDTGVFDTNGYDMFVAEDWANNVDDTGFIEGTQTVTFDGSYSSDITTDETFYNLTAANPAYTGWKVPQVMDNLTINVTNDLNINDGCMKVRSNSIINVGNDLTILNDAGLDMSSYYNQQLNISGDWINDNITYTTWIGFHPGNNSIVTFNGSTDQVVITQTPQEDFANLVIDNSGGEFRSNDNIQVLGNLLLFDGEWNDNVPSLTHTFHGDFEVTSNAAWYTHINPNTVVFAGENDQEFIYNHIGAGYFKDVIIDKSPVDIAMNNALDQPATTVNREVIESRAQTITMYTDMDIQIGGTLTINEGTLDVNGNILRAYGDVTINSGGILSMNSNSTLWISDGSELSVNGGNLNAIGTPGNLVNFRHRNTGYYDLNVENGGTIAAEYAQFQHMGSNGVYVIETGLVDPAYAFNYCTFQNGTVGEAALLLINNVDDVTITGANFPDASSSDYNVAKTSDQGTITMIDAIGDFAGPNFENDTFNRIDWDGYAPDLTITNVVWTDTNPYVCDQITATVTVYNNGNIASAGFCVDLYYNLGSPPIPSQFGDQYELINVGIPAGDFILVDFDVINNIAESWNSYVQVDADQVITELNESNNVWGPDAITWNGLPVIDDLTIQYNVGTNEIELNWTYPITVDQYKIYRSIDPYNFSGADIFTSSTESYSETITGTKYFYHVTTERTCTATDNSDSKETIRMRKR